MFKDEGAADMELNYQGDGVGTRAGKDGSRDTVLNFLKQSGSTFFTPSQKGYTSYKLLKLMTFSKIQPCQFFPKK